MRPAHYKGAGDLQPIHLIHALGLGFDAGCVVKYVCRAGRKPGEEALNDLQKARQYLDWLIAAIEGKPVIKPEGWYDAKAGELPPLRLQWDETQARLVPRDSPRPGDRSGDVDDRGSPRARLWRS